MIRIALAVIALYNPQAHKAKPVNLTEDQKIIHVLNRLGFGPRPGDVERVKKQGLKNYIEEQLNPEKLKDEAVEAKAAQFSTLKMTGMEIAEMERQVQMSNQQRQRLQAAMAQRGATDGAAAIQNAVTSAQSGTPPHRPSSYVMRRTSIAMPPPKSVQCWTRAEWRDRR